MQCQGWGRFQLRSVCSSPVLSKSKRWSSWQRWLTTLRFSFPSRTQSHALPRTYRHASCLTVGVRPTLRKTSGVERSEVFTSKPEVSGKKLPDRFLNSVKKPWSLLSTSCISPIHLCFVLPRLFGVAGSVGLFVFCCGKHKSTGRNINIFKMNDF